MSNLKSCKILDTVQVVVNVSAAESRLSAWRSLLVGRVKVIRRACQSFPLSSVARTLGPWVRAPLRVWALSLWWYDVSIRSTGSSAGRPQRYRNPENRRHCALLACDVQFFHMNIVEKPCMSNLGKQNQHLNCNHAAIKNTVCCTILS
jgi:hypothetical protein